jgi:hypothetical protein
LYLNETWRVKPVREGEREEYQDDTLDELHMKLARAYQKPLENGPRISSRVLAKHAHVRPTTDYRWLALYHLESLYRDVEDEETENT